MTLKKLFQRSKDKVENGLDKVKAMTDKGKAYVATADKVLEVSENLLNKLGLPPVVKDKGKEVVDGLRNLTDKADSLLHQNDLVKLLALISPESSKILGQPVQGYSYVITEDRNQPFQLTEQILETAKQIVEGKFTDEEKAWALYQWVESNISYGDHGRARYQKGYRHAAEVFADREGVCGEMAILYVSMARAVGLLANYASVDRDNKGAKVKHACAALQLSGKQVLVDPAYHTFDIKHLGYQVLSDQEAVPHFKRFRGV